MGWDFMDPKGYFAEIAWTPVLMWCQFKALAAFERKEMAVGGGLVLGGFSAEALLSLRMAGLALLCLAPALIWSAYATWDGAGARVIAVALALAGGLPPLVFTLRRLFMLPVMLWQGLGPSAARHESARLSEGKLMKVLPWLLGGQAAGLLLQGLGEIHIALALFALPASFLAGLWGLAISYRKLL